MITVKQSSIHNKGVFASKDIKKDQKIIQYVGKKVPKAEADVIGEETLIASNNHKDGGGVYLFELDDNYDIDGNVPNNPARFINHSCSPNCETLNEDGKIWIIAIKDIKENEELFYNYGYELETEDLEDHPCYCKSKNCVGYILAEEHWNKIPAKAL